MESLTVEYFQLNENYIQNIIISNKNIKNLTINIMCDITSELLILFENILQRRNDIHLLYQCSPYTVCDHITHTTQVTYNKGDLIYDRKYLDKIKEILKFGMLAHRFEKYSSNITSLCDHIYDEMFDDIKREYGHNIMIDGTYHTQFYIELLKRYDDWFEDIYVYVEDLKNIDIFKLLIKQLNRVKTIANQENWKNKLINSINYLSEHTIFVIARIDEILQKPPGNPPENFFKKQQRKHLVYKSSYFPVKIITSYNEENFRLVYKYYKKAKISWKRSILYGRHRNIIYLKKGNEMILYDGINTEIFWNDYRNENVY